MLGLTVVPPTVRDRGHQNLSAAGQFSDIDQKPNRLFSLVNASRGLKLGIFDYKPRAGSALLAIIR